MDKPPIPPPDLIPASDAERGGGDLTASLAGERLAAHLRRAGFVLMRSRGAPPHSAG
ncbi:MAG: hypothetical protein O9325_20795 [Roseomonas sp.]|nr:hypothetical protein [Roseomonas sp.]